MPSAKARERGVCSGRGERLVELEQREPSVSLGSPGARESVTMPAISFFSSPRGREQRDGVVVALAHLAAVQAGQQVATSRRRPRLGQHEEMFAVEVVEALRRNRAPSRCAAPGRGPPAPMRVEHQDVGGHQHRVHVQAHA
jgi:hypothetical protein